MSISKDGRTWTLPSGDQITVAHDGGARVRLEVLDGGGRRSTVHLKPACVAELAAALQEMAVHRKAATSTPPKSAA